MDPRRVLKVLALSPNALLVIALRYLSTPLSSSETDAENILCVDFGRDSGVGVVGVTGLLSRDQGDLLARVYKEGTGRSSVERDHGGRKKEGTGVRSSREGGEECTDAAEKEERRL
ncbi:hypothetical protein Syun_009641 [Stephania yunnanensis]|uniref:Uncharacterized protein n=1 Tax=Stephania yunnanensis TaxID=152371 RepID=A0AAP0KF08_9MAGN